MQVVTLTDKQVEWITSRVERKLTRQYRYGWNDQGDVFKSNEARITYSNNLFRARVFEEADGRRCGESVGVIDPFSVRNVNNEDHYLSFQLDPKQFEHLGFESTLNYNVNHVISYDENHIENLLILSNPSLDSILRDVRKFAQIVTIEDLNLDTYFCVKEDPAVAMLDSSEEVRQWAQDSYKSSK